MEIRKLITEIFEKHQQKVNVCCDENHAHSAIGIGGCLTGPPESVEVCVLCEYIDILESRLVSIKKLIEKDVT